MSARDIVLALVVVIIWGLNFVAIKWGVAEISPFMLTALRYIGAVLPAIFFVRRPAVSWKLLVAYGMSVGVLQFGFLFSAIRLGMPAGLASLVIQMQAFFTIGFAMLLLRERPNRFQLLGALIALSGLAAVATERLEGAVLVPLLMTLAASFFWGVSNIVTKQAGKIDMLAFMIWGSMVPPIPMLLLAYIFDGPTAFTGLAHIGPLAIGSVLFIAYGSTLIGYGAWAVLIGRYPASTIAPFTLLVPVVGFGGAMVFLGEGITGLEVLGSVLIFLGLVLNVFGPRLWRRWRAA